MSKFFQKTTMKEEMLSGFHLVETKGTHGREVATFFLKARVSRHFVVE